MERGPGEPLGSARILIADDDDQDRIYIAGKIASWGCITETAIDGADALAKALEFDPHVIVSDIRMPRLDGFKVIEHLRERGYAPPVILLTQFGDIQTAVSAVHGAGAFWFLEKPISLPALRGLIDRASGQRKLENENQRLRRVLKSDSLGNMVGRTPKMQEIFQLIRRVAPSKATVLITGESGTGKELVARAIHESSPRSDAPFVALNCAALPESLIESELFGHEKGAFTGAADRRLGRIELAHGGTLFLDEIGELPVGMQAKLLRVLEDSKVQRLGGRIEIEVDVRILAATNRPPQKALDEGTLREDLYYRLNVFHIELPPLRERKEDIPLLIFAILDYLKQRHDCVHCVEPEAIEQLSRYDWPGNIRELRNILERALIFAGDGPITVAQLPHVFGLSSGHTFQENTQGAPSPAAETCSATLAAPPNPSDITIPLGSSAHDAEKALILATLAYTGRDRRKTAEILGLSLKTIQVKLKEYRLAEAVESEVPAVVGG